MSCIRNASFISFICYALKNEMPFLVPAFPAKIYTTYDATISINGTQLPCIYSYVEWQLTVNNCSCRMCCNWKWAHCSYPAKRSRILSHSRGILIGNGRVRRCRHSNYRSCCWAERWINGFQQAIKMSKLSGAFLWIAAAVGQPHRASS